MAPAEETHRVCYQVKQSCSPTASTLLPAITRKPGPLIAESQPCLLCAILSPVSANQVLSLLLAVRAGADVEIAFDRKSAPEHGVWQSLSCTECSDVMALLDRSVSGCEHVGFLLLELAGTAWCGHGHLVAGSILGPLCFAACLFMLWCCQGWEVLLSQAFMLQQKQLKKFSGTGFALPLAWPFPFSHSVSKWQYKLGWSILVKGMDTAWPT